MRAGHPPKDSGRQRALLARLPLLLARLRGGRTGLHSRVLHRPATKPSTPTPASSKSGGDKIAGIAVHIGARVMSLAGAGEVLVSGTVKDLTAGAGLAFEARGAHVLKVVPGEWLLYRVGDGR